MKKKILFVLSLLLGLMFINAGLNKFLNYIPQPEEMPEAVLNDFQAMMEISWLMPLIAIVEIVGGLLIIIPKTRALGALLILPILAGILLMHIIVEPSGMFIAFLLATVLAWLLFENRHKYRKLIE